jgi:hypothetical protein
MPYRSKQIISADHALAVPDYVDQKVKSHRGNRHQITPAAQLPSVGTEPIIFKRIQHLAFLACYRRRSSVPIET